MSVAVITGTIGADTLCDTIRSVQSQTVPVQHWIIIDGVDFEYITKKMIGKMPRNNNRMYSQHILTLPENTGGSGYLCHRINASLPWLVNTDYVCFLDEDNVFEPDHIEKLLGALRSVPNARWSYAHRTIIDGDGTFICNDNCESLGSMTHTALGREDRHIDTNCYLLDRELAMQICPLWNAKARQSGALEADRHVCRVLLEREPIHGVSKHYTVGYRVCGRPDSVRGDFFMQGNALLGRGVGGYDARKENLYIFHFDAQQTADYCHGERDPNPLGEWCPGMWHNLCEQYNLHDGFANARFLPRNARCLITMCSPETLPLKLFESRQDLVKILYTAEGPNIRHKDQWTKSFLKNHFDIVLTHWQPVLDDPDIRTIYCPHNARFLDLPKHTHVLRTNKGQGTKSIAMVLERRPTHGTYDIDSTSLTCLDNLREVFASGLENVTVYGDGWTEFCESHPTVTLGYSMPRHLDTDHTPIDHYETRDFALIIENCDAVGYVSEKIGDAFIAGAIPLYYGNPSELSALPADAYIDIRKFKNGYDLQSYLDTLTREDIDALKARVCEVRNEFIDARGRKVIAARVDQALKIYSDGI
jgi:hypothetical protein